MPNTRPEQSGTTSPEKNTDIGSGDLPPEVPLSNHSHPDMQQLTHGCWSLEINPDQGTDPGTVTGLPRAVVEGDFGSTATAPPLPIGLEAIFAPMTNHHWLLTVQVAPEPPAYQRDSMLLATRSKLLFEETSSGWVLRFEF